MANQEFINTPAGRLYGRLLELLRRDVEATGFILQRDARNLIELGTMSAGRTNTVLPLGDYVLVIGKSPADLKTAERVALKSVRALMKVLISSIEQGPADGSLGRISFASLAGDYLEVLKQLETRTSLYENYERLIQLSHDILLAGDLHSVLQIIMDMAKEAIGGEGSSLLLVDSRTGEMYFNVVSGERGQELSEIRIPSGQGIAGSIVRNARPELIRDVKRDPRAYTAVDQKLRQTTRDMVVAPIIARGQVIGVIEVINSVAEDGFVESDLEFLENIASQSSLLIENARSKEDLINSNQRLDRKVTEVNALYEIGRVLTSTLEINELKPILLRTIMKILGAARGSILELREGEHGPELRGTADMSLSEQGFKDHEQTTTYRGVKDILLWMKQNREPWFFVGENATAGLTRRLRENNPEADTLPDVWIPITDAHGEGDNTFVVSLSGESFHEKSDEHELGMDPMFYRSIMTQAGTAFHNVRSHRDTILAREKEKQIRHMFQKYVPARVVQEVLEQEDASRPRAQHVSVLFADIRGFTRMTELLEPRILVELLNEFFEEMAPIVDRHDGIIDKFMGDSLMAVFGVPAPGQYDARNALLCARDIQRGLRELNRARTESNRPAFICGIGLHSGPVIAGNIGASRRLDYTVIGDTVNLASRLEKMAKFYKAGIIVTEEMLREANAAVPRRELDLLLVRGRVEVNRVFEMLDASAERITPILDDWNEALAEYRARKFENALARFESIKNRLESDPVSDIYMERCRKLMAEPPPEDWDAVHRVEI